MKLQELFESGSLPRHLYHCTMIDNIQSIERDGLKSGYNGIFLTDDEHQAAEYAALFPAHTKCVILRIDTRILDKAKLKADAHGLEEIGREGDVSWEDSLKYRNQITYMQNIPPQYIEFGEEFSI